MNKEREELDMTLIEEMIQAKRGHMKNYEQDNCLTSFYYILKREAEALENISNNYMELRDDIDNKAIAYVDTPEFQDRFIDKAKLQKLYTKEANEVVFGGRNNGKMLGAGIKYGRLQLLKELIGEWKHYEN